MSFNLPGSKRQLYKKTPQGDLDLYIFTPQDMKKGEKRPAIVFFFGGGWTTGTPERFLYHCKDLSERGMVAISADYRILNRHKTTPFESVADAKSAIRWVRSHAGELGVDPSRIVAGGGSAGGHLAACTAIIPGLDEAGEDLSVSCAANALVLFNPATDTTAPRFGARFGARAREASPVHHLRSGLPPTLIFHGEADEVIPVDRVRAFADAMKKHGNDCEIFTYPNVGHGFFNWTKEEDHKHYYLTMKEVYSFLEKLGYLKASQNEKTLVNI